MRLKQKLALDIAVLLAGIVAPYGLMLRFYSDINTRPANFAGQNLLFCFMIASGILSVYLAGKHRHTASENRALRYKVVFSLLEALAILLTLGSIWLFYAVVTLRGI